MPADANWLIATIFTLFANHAIKSGSIPNPISIRERTGWTGRSNTPADIRPIVIPNEHFGFDMISGPRVTVPGKSYAP
jgi:hypothetical protein